MAPFSMLACGQQMGLGHEWTFSPAELGSCTQEARLCSGDRLQVTGWLHAVQCISVPQMQPQSLPEGKKRSLMPWVPPSTGRRVRVASPLTEFKGGQAQRAPWAVDRLVSHNHDLAPASGGRAPGLVSGSGRARLWHQLRPGALISATATWPRSTAGGWGDLIQNLKVNSQTSVFLSEMAPCQP